MKTWLLGWNPQNWDWINGDGSYYDHMRTIEQIGFSYSTWSVGVNTSIKTGDRIFLIRLGVEPKGIVASGYAASPVFLYPHWDYEKRKAGLYAKKIYVKWDKILNSEQNNILPIDKLEAIAPDFHWHIQASGVNVSEGIADDVEREWDMLHSLYVEKENRTDIPIRTQQQPTKQGKKKPPFTFDLAEIPIGSKVHFIKDSEITAVVIDEKRVLYNGEKYTLTLLAKELLGKNDGIRGPLFFTYEGEVIAKRRMRIEMTD